MIWTRKSAVEDERIVNMKNKIFKEAYALIMTICSISVIVKTFMFSDMESVMLELLILAGGSLYCFIRSVTLGLYSDEVEVHDRKRKMSFSKRIALTGLVIGFSIAMLLGIRSAVLYGDGGGATTIKYFFLVFFVSLIIYIPFFVAAVSVLHYFANKVSRNMSHNDLES